jgi:hypothetical protein
LEDGVVRHGEIIKSRGRRFKTQVLPPPARRSLIIMGAKQD